MATSKNDLIVRLVAQDRLSKPIKKVQSSIIRFVGAVSASLAAVRVVSFPIKQALDFDRALRDVQKTTGFTDNQISKLSNDLNKLGSQLAVTQQDLAEIAAVGGQLGLGSFGVDAIRDFTESVARAQVTLGLTADKAAEVGAQLLNIFHIDVSEIENLFSLVNELTNNSVANANDLADIMKRIGNIAGLTAQEAGSLAALSRDLGVSPEVAGTAWAKFFTNISTKADDFADVMSISTEEWVSKIEVNALDALKDASRAISQLDGVAKASAIKDLFGGGRLFSVGTKFVDLAESDFARLTELQTLANVGFAEGTSSLEEYDNILKSVKEQFNLVAGSVRRLAIEVGNTLLPDLQKVATALQNFLTGDVGRDLFLELGRGFKSAAIYIEEMVSALVNSDVAWGEVLNTIENILLAIAAFIGFQLATHIGVMVTRWYQWGKAVAQLGQTLRKNTSQYLELSHVVRASEAEQAAGTARTIAGLKKETISIKTLQKAYIELSKAEKQAAIAGTNAAGNLIHDQLRRVDVLLKKVRELNPTIKSLSAVRGTSTLTDPFKKLTTSAQAQALRLQQAQLKANQELLASDTLLHERRKAYHAQRIARLREAQALHTKGSKQYIALEQQIAAAQAIHAKESRKALRIMQEYRTNVAILNKVVDTNTVTLKRNYYQMLVTAGASTRLALAFSSAAAAAGKFSRSILGVGAALAKMQKVGRGALAFLGGWPGVLLEVAFATWIFWDDIVEAFEDGGKKITESQKRTARALARANAEIVKGYQATFESVVNSSQFGGGAKPVDFDKILKTEGLLAFSKAAAHSADSLAKFAEAAKGGEATSEGLIESINAENLQLDQLFEDRADILDRMRKAQALATGAERPADRKQAEEDLVALRKEHEKISEELVKRQQVSENLVSLEESIAEQTAIVKVNADSMARQLVNSKVMTKEAIALLQVQRQRKGVEESISETLLKEKEALAQLQEEADKPAEDRSDSYNRSAEEARKYGRELQSLVYEQQELRKNALEFKEVLTGEQISIVNSQARASTVVVQSLVDTYNKLSESGVVATQEELNDKLRDTVKNAIHTKAEFTVMLEKFVAYRKPIDDVLDAIDGVFDNISKTVKKTQQDLADLGTSLDEIISKRKLEREIAGAIKKQDAKLAKDEEAINKKADDRIRKALAEAASIGGQPSQKYLKSVEDRRAAELAAAQAANDTAKAEIEASAIREKAAGAIDELTNSMGKLRTVQAELATLSKDKELLKTPEGAEKIKELQGESQKLQGDIKNLTSSAEEFVEQLAGVGGTKLRYPGDTTGAPIVSDSELRDINSAITSAVAGFDQLQKSSAESAQAAAKGIRTALNATQSGFKTQVQEANNIIKSFTANLDDAAKGAIESSTNLLIDQLRNTLPKAYLDFKTLVENNQVSMIPEELKEGAYSPEDVLNVFREFDLGDRLREVIGGAAVQTINEINTNLKDITFELNDAAKKKLRDDTQAAIAADEFLLEGKFSTIDVSAIQDQLDDGSLGGGKGFTLPVTVQVTNPNTLERLTRIHPTQSNAAGGHIRGKGTGTSDSILSWLSNGEYVLKAKAVKEYGLNFLNRMNSMTLPKYALPAFAMGGDVTRTINNMSSSLVSSEGSTERVQLDINMGGESATLFGEREQVRQFVSSMTRLTRGSN